MEVYDTFEYGIDLTSNGTMYAAGGEGKTKKYLNAVLYDHIVSMTLPCIGKYKIGYNDGENPEIVAKNTIIKLGISPCTDVGANLVIAIKKAIMAEIPSLSSSSSSSSSSASSSALQSSSPDSLPPIFNNVSKSPFDDVLCLTGPQPDPEEHDSPLSIPYKHLSHLGVDPHKPFMLKKHLAGCSSNGSKGLCPDCKAKHYVNDSTYDFMVTYSTYKGFINIGWNLDENESEEACLVNVEKAFKKAGVVHVPLESINSEVKSRYREIIAQLKETRSAEYSAELRRLRTEREERVRAEKRKVEEISQNITSIKEEAKAREMSRDRINKAIEIDRINRQANRDATVSKGAIVHGSGIGGNVSSMKDIFGPKDETKIIAPDGTVELKPPSSKYNKTGIHSFNDVTRGKGRSFDPVGHNCGKFPDCDDDDEDDGEDDVDPIFSRKFMSDPKYFEAIRDMARRDPSFDAKFNKKLQSDPPFEMFFKLLAKEMGREDGMIERGAPPPRREVKKAGHVLDDDSGSPPATNANPNPFATASPIGTPPQPLSSINPRPTVSPPSSTTSDVSPPSDSEYCGKQFINDAAIPCVTARVTYNGKRVNVTINETATMEQLYSHVAWLFKGALPAGFKLLFARNPKGCTYEKGIIPNTPDDTVKIIDRNSINIMI